MSGGYFFKEGSSMSDNSETHVINGVKDGDVVVINDKPFMYYKGELLSLDEVVEQFKVIWKKVQTTIEHIAKELPSAIEKAIEQAEE